MSREAIPHRQSRRYRRRAGNSSGPTDATGLYELVSPAGTIGVVAHHQKQSGRGTVTVSPGGTVPLTVVLQKDAPKKP